MRDLLSMTTKNVLADLRYFCADSGSKNAHVLLAFWLYSHETVKLVLHAFL
jgi:hypothetical protein